ncbi:hypothetical protein LJB91_00795 [Bacteroidales bacterium OttesenSCG-928-L03]|nr:hypothetical protein [Bacteroidales bacterium OttesenSCG-928-L03]
MKRVLSLLFVCALGVWGIQGQNRIVFNTDTIFSANFDDISGTGGNDGGWSGSIAGTTLTEYSTDGAAWILTKAYKGDKCLKLGTGSLQGIATTPTLTKLSGNATLTFKAGAWNGANEQTELLLEISGSGTLSKSSVTLIKGEFSTYSVIITGGEDDTQITFKGKQASNSRFFLDEIVVLPGGDASKSDDASLSSLKVGDEEISTGVSNYVYELPAGTTELPAITPIANHDKATLGTPTMPTIAGILDGTANQYSITVTAEDGTERTFTITFSIYSLPEGVIFEERCDWRATGTNTSVTDWTNWDNQGKVTFSGNTQVRFTSQTAHIYFYPSSAQYPDDNTFTISGINTSAHENLTLSYDVACNKAQADAAGILVEAYDVTANKRDTLEVPSFIMEEANTYRNIANLSVPTTTNLQLTFWTTEATNPTGYGYRLDNIQIHKGEEQPTPQINANLASLKYGILNLGDEFTKTANISAENLTEAISYELVGESKTAFSVTKDAEWDNMTGGTLSITYAPTVVRKDTVTLEIKSAGAETQVITLYGEGTQIIDDAKVIARFNAYNPENIPTNGIFLANGGNAANKGIATLTRDATVASSVYAIYTDRVAATTGWDGADTIAKYWIVTFSTKDLSNLKLTSKQRGSNSGPKEFKVQYQVGSGEWTDVIDSIIPIGSSNYTVGTLEDIALPAAINNQESVNLRWLCLSTTSINNGTVAAGGVNRLDVLITQGSGVNLEEITKPNSAAYAYFEGNSLQVKNAPKDAVITVYNIAGAQVAQTTDTEIVIPAKGIYIVKMGNKVQKVINK